MEEGGGSVGGKLSLRLGAWWKGSPARCSTPSSSAAAPITDFLNSHRDIKSMAARTVAKDIITLRGSTAIVSEFFGIRVFDVLAYTDTDVAVPFTWIESDPKLIANPQMVKLHSFDTKGDQASIIGGAINFVKELEHVLHFLGAQKEAEERKSDAGGTNNNKPFSEFFSFPQYSTSVAGGCEHSAAAIGIPEQVSGIHSGIAGLT